MWEEFTSFFERQSALANFLQIGAAAVGCLLVVWRGGKWALRRIELTRLSTVSLWLARRPHQALSAKSLRIAVVDDHPEDYPLESLRRLGYSVVHIGRLGLGDVPALLSYQCVLLDINGVLVEDLKRGGLEILKRLKAADGPYVVAVSSKGFDITMSEFFMLADHRLKKPIPQAEVEGIIEGAYRARYSAVDAARRVDEAASFGGSGTWTKRRVLRKVIEFLEGESDEEAAQGALSLIVPSEVVKGVLSDLKIVQRSLVQVP
jgi:DNA-binding response OmpR family regulator